MLKKAIKDFGLLVILSFLFMNVYGLLNVIFNFLVFISYIGRVTLSMVTSSILYLLVLYLLSKTKGYNITNTTEKFGLDVSMQLYGTIIGTSLYFVISLVLFFCPSGVQELFLSFYYIGCMPYYCICQWFDIGTFSYDGCYICILIECPFLLLVRLLGLYNGRSIKITECPSLALYDSNINKELERTHKHSWKDSIKLYE